MRARALAPEGAEGHVHVYRPAEARAHVRATGSDVKAYDRALDAGTVLGPPQIALLAAIGRGTVRVRPRPRVVVMSTGSELVQPDEVLGSGQIYDSNSFALTAAARDSRRPSPTAWAPSPTMPRPSATPSRTSSCAPTSWSPRAE